MEIGLNIMKEREAQGLSREELASAINKSVDLVSKIERGERRISAEDLTRVAATLCQPVGFFTGPGEVSEVEKELEHIIEKAGLEPRDAAEFHRLTRMRTKEAVVSLVKSLEASRFEVLREHIAEAEIELKLDGSYEKWWHRRIEVLDSELVAYKVRYSTEHEFGGQTFTGFKARLVQDRCHREHGTMNIEKVSTLVNTLSYAIVFRPRLQRGDIAELCCEEYVPNAAVMTREGLERLIQAGKFMDDSPRQRTRARVSVPTDLLRRKLVFPRNYEISGIDVQVSVQAMPLFDERERVHKSGYVSHMKVHGRWVLELQVPRPVVGALYCLSWSPPGENEFAQLVAENGGLLRKKKSRKDE